MNRITRLSAPPATWPLLLLAGGCIPVCPEPAAVDGTWDVFATVLTHDGLENPAFPVYFTPANGSSRWRIAWGPETSGFVELWIDDDPVQAEGAWDQEVCGAFSLSMEGVARGDLGSRHVFSAQADLLLVEDDLVGTWDWFETWTTSDGASTGVFEATGRLEGSR